MQSNFLRSGWLALGIVAATAALFWLVVLPTIARWSPVDRHLRLMQERRINASAMFYTELENIPPADRPVVKTESPSETEVGSAEEQLTKG